MSRVDTLYARLDELVPRLEERSLAELDRVASHGSSMYLKRRMTPYFDGRRYRSKEVAEVENLANAVIGLKEKLGESLEAGVTGIILSYEGLRDVSWGERPDYEAEIDLARHCAEELRAEICARGRAESQPNNALQPHAGLRPASADRLRWADR